MVREIRHLQGAGINQAVGLAADRFERRRPRASLPSFPSQAISGSTLSYVRFGSEAVTTFLAAGMGRMRTLATYRQEWVERFCNGAFNSAVTTTGDSPWRAAAQC